MDSDAREVLPELIIRAKTETAAPEALPEYYFRLCEAETITAASATIKATIAGSQRQRSGPQGTLPPGNTAARDSQGHPVRNLRKRMSHSEETGMTHSDELTIDEVRELILEGREQGYLSSDRVADVLQDIELSTEQIENIYAIFLEMGIDVVEEEDDLLVAARGRGGQGRRGGDPQPSRPVRQDSHQRSRCGSTSRRSAGCRCSPPRRKSPWPSASSARTWKPSAS